MFKLQNFWTQEWDTEFYDYDFNTYTWQPKLIYDSSIISSDPKWQTHSLYSKDNLKIIIEKYTSFSQSGDLESGYLEMKVFNDRGNVTSTKFIQLKPFPDPSDPLTNLFPLISGTTNEHVNETEIVELNPATFNNYVDGTYFEVKAEVTNDWGDKAVSFLTFIKNQKPIIGDITVTWPSTPWRVKEEIHINLTGNWYNQEIDDFDLYISVKIELLNGDIIVVQINEFSKDSFKFTLPVLSTTSDDNLSVNLIVTATNLYDLSTSLNRTLIVNNTLSSDYRDSLHDSNLDLTDLQAIAYLSAQMGATLTPQIKGIEDQKICIDNSDCSGNGDWVSNQTNNICKCNNGYFGVDWIFTSQELSTLETIVPESIRIIIKEFMSKNHNLRVEYEDLFLVFNNLLIRPELINYNDLNVIIPFLGMMVNKVSASLSLSEDFYTSFFQSASYILARIKYEYNYILPQLKESSYEIKLKDLKQKEIELWTIAERMLLFEKR